MFLAALLAVIVGGFLSTLIWIMVLVAMVAGSMQGKTTGVAPHSILVVNLDEDINDAPNVDPLSQFDMMNMQMNQSMSLYSALCALDAAKNDNRIEGIYIRLNGGGAANNAAIEELRDAILDFKEQSGKFVVAYNESYTQGAYYLATAADLIYLHPEGGMSWQGVGFDLTFYKGLLDKLGITVEVFRPTACKYKSAVEPFILDRMSDANRQQMSELAHSMWSTITAAVSEARGISVEELNALADNLAVTLPEEALANRFVDGLVYEDQMNDIFADYGVKAGKDGEYNFVTLGEYASQTLPAGNFKADKVAIIYAEGEIVDGYGNDGKIYGNSMAELVKSARLDESIQSVVLRVNSPGGSALASDIIWREIELLKAEKPVIVSMGGYAASGGYYISCPADAIVADKLTLTGSIGVFGMMPYGGKFLKEKLGVTFDGVGTNKYSVGGGLTSPLSPAERATIMRGVDKVYTTFTTNVSEGRNLPIENVLDIAGGRVWSGEEALGIGLADINGGLKTAIAIAADKAALTDFRVVEITDEPSGFAEIFSALNARIARTWLDSKLGSFSEEYMHLRSVVERSGIQAYCPYLFNID